MATEILSNGSKWAGEHPDPIDTLFDRLASDTLDPTFEEYGNFVETLDDGRTLFWGNFLTRSHVFRIATDDAELIGNLSAAIRANQQTQDYAEARI